MINEYAKAFFELSNESNNLEEMIESFEVFNQNYNGDFKKLLESPKIAKTEKKEIIKKCFKSCNELFVNCINVVVDNSRVDMLDEIYKDFNKLVDELNNIVKIEVYSFEKITEEINNSILEKLSKVFKDKKVILNNIIDDTLIGGYKLFHNGVQIDGSLKNQLNMLKANL